MRAFAFLFSFLFLIQLNASAICSAYCEATKVPPCHELTESEKKQSDIFSARSCCEGASPCNVIDEQANLFVPEKNNTNKKVDVIVVVKNRLLESEVSHTSATFIVTHYSINGPPLYLLYSQLKIPSAA